MCRGLAAGTGRLEKLTKEDFGRKQGGSSRRGNRMTERGCAKHSWEQESLGTCSDSLTSGGPHLRFEGGFVRTGTTQVRGTVQVEGGIQPGRIRGWERWESNKIRFSELETSTLLAAIPYSGFCSSLAPCFTSTISYLPSPRLQHPSLVSP